MPARGGRRQPRHAAQLPQLPPLPTEFARRMRHQLGNEGAALIAALEQPPAVGLRVNPLKLPTSALPTLLEQLTPWRPQPVPWCPTGYLMEAQDDVGEAASDTKLLGQSRMRPGLHPWHGAGAYYLQEPSAMAAAELLGADHGDRIIDLAAAPGGKASQLAGKLAGTGLLLANDPHPARARALLGNLERCGVDNAVVTGSEPRRLAAALPGYFDRVLLDAPCSGEGMFRKSAEARRAWSPALVTACARRQAELLDSAARLVRPGGRLCYSTCTLNLEENEQVVLAFLRAWSEFSLVPAELPGTSQGMAGLAGAVRIWPHRAGGDGHFLALLVRSEDAPPEPGGRQRRRARTSAAPLGASVEQAWRSWSEGVLASAVQVRLSKRRLALHGRHLLAYPEDLPALTGVHVLRAGLHLADIAEAPADGTRDRTRSEVRDQANGHARDQARDHARSRGRAWARVALASGGRAAPRLEPAHALAMWLPADHAAASLDLAPDDPRLQAYLAGQPVPSEGTAGDILVCTLGLSLGWGRRKGGELRSSLPKGLRRAAEHPTAPPAD